MLCLFLADIYERRWIREKKYKSSMEHWKTDPILILFSDTNARVFDSLCMNLDRIYVIFNEDDLSKFKEEVAYL